MLGFSWDLFFEKNFGINLGNYRNCSVQFFVVSLAWNCLLLLFLISESQHRRLMEPHRAVREGPGGSAPFLFS